MSAKRVREDDEDAAKRTAALAPEQRNAVALAADGRSLALLGPAGTGKSHVVRHIVDALRARHGGGVEVTASTGAAAYLVGGRTLHSFAGTGIGGPDRYGIMYSCATKDGAKARWREVRALVVDEISMVDAGYLDLLDRIARRNRGGRAPFGGIQVVVVGDFYQLAPVDGAYAFEARCWAPLFAGATVCLTRVFRQADPLFVGALHALRTNTLAAEQHALLAACSQPVPHAVRLFAFNHAADALNQTELRKLPGADTTYRAIDTGTGAAFPVDARVALRVGARVMLRANLNVSAGLVNGACGTVAALTPHSATVAWDSGATDDVTEHMFAAENKDKKGCTRTQMPLILAWAISIHKSQGTSLERVEVDLRGAWADGQAYVALSRAVSRDGLCVRGLEPARIRASDKVRAFYATQK